MAVQSTNIKLNPFENYSNNSIFQKYCFRKLNEINYFSPLKAKVRQGLEHCAEIMGDEPVIVYRRYCELGKLVILFRGIGNIVF